MPTRNQISEAMQRHIDNAEATAREYRESGREAADMKAYLEKAAPTYLENWPAALCRLSIAQVGIRLTLDEARALGSNIIEWSEGFELPFGQDVSSVADRVREAAAKFPGGAFVRLGSRSPKDSWLGQRDGFKVRASDVDPLRFFKDCSERTYEDLKLAIGTGYEPSIFVRQWVDMPPEAEFRCFMRGRKLVGISQYNYHDYYPWITEHQAGIRWAIEQFFQQFQIASHLNDVVFDVFVKHRRQADENTHVWEVKLLEINPLFEFTDPCLFDWRGGGDFDGGMRIVQDPISH